MIFMNRFGGSFCWLSHKAAVSARVPFLEHKSGDDTTSSIKSRLWADVGLIVFLPSRDGSDSNLESGCYCHTF